MSSPATDTASMENALKQVLADFSQALDGIQTLPELEELKVQFLGRNSELNTIRKGLGKLSNEERPVMGALANDISQQMNDKLDAAMRLLKQALLKDQLEAERIDVTMPAAYRAGGTTHPLTLVIDQICDIFHGMGYNCLDDDQCPEVETEYYNFEALNFPDDHPARDMQDTFYTSVAPHVLLRSQTSNAQIRHMETHKPPIRIISPGRVYRNEAVSSRKSVLFHQIEGLCINHKSQPVTMADLKGTLYQFAKLFFGGDTGKERPIRFRGSYFPFTEPSVEVDVECILCAGEGCRTCGQLGWLEVLGAGMVHPNVLDGCGIDSNEFQGFAFGMGVERMAMLKYAIRDIRQFYTNDVRFLKQFKGL